MTSMNLMHSLKHFTGVAPHDKHAGLKHQNDVGEDYHQAEGLPVKNALREVAHADGLDGAVPPQDAKGDLPPNSRLAPDQNDDADEAPKHSLADAVRGGRQMARRHM